MLLLGSCISIATALQQPTPLTFPNGTGNVVMFGPFLERLSGRIPDTFVSANFDWNLNKSHGDAWTNASIGWTLDLQDKRLIARARDLAPANLRVGGSNADVAVYGGFPGGERCSPEVIDKKACLTPARFDELVEFCRKTGLRLIFDLNIMKGRAQDPALSWNASNALALLRYAANKYPSFPHGFELGNEKEYVLGPRDTAQCFLQLRHAVDKLWAKAPAGGKPLVVGPALNPRPDWLGLFLDALDAAVQEAGTGTVPPLDAVTYHVYPGYGRSLDLPTLMLEPGWLPFAHDVIDATRGVVQSSETGRRAELWISETAAAWASGTAGVCDGFLSGFWWLDQLAFAASHGHSAMCRQCLVGGNYSLLDQLDDFKPNPDYWTAWVWRKLVGNGVLDITQVMPYMGDYVPQVRGYLFCTRRSSGLGLGEMVPKGAVTFAFLNQDRAENKSILMYQQSRMQFQTGMDESGYPRLGDPGSGGKPWGPTPPPFANLRRIEYVFTPPSGDVLSRDTMLNGVLLRVGTDGALPPFQDMGRTATGEAFVVPPLSYGFAVYPDAAAPACI